MRRRFRPSSPAASALFSPPRNRLASSRIVNVTRGSARTTQARAHARPTSYGPVKNQRLFRVNRPCCLSAQSSRCYGHRPRELPRAPASRIYIDTRVPCRFIMSNDAARNVTAFLPCHAAETFVYRGSRDTAGLYSNLKLLLIHDGQAGVSADGIRGVRWIEQAGSKRSWRETRTGEWGIH